MISLPAKILVATAPVNLHLSFDRLTAIVRAELGADPKADTAVVFHNCRRTHVKVLWHDGRGYCVLYKRLDRGTYRIPEAIPAGAKRQTGDGSPRGARCVAAWARPRGRSSRSGDGARRSMTF